MDTIGDEACALKVARALSYINFSSLERWFGHPGFIKIFQGLKGEGTDLGWAILLGAIECAACGDRHLPKQVIYRILRENRVTVQHLQELFGDSSPVRPHAGGLMVGSIDLVPQEAAPEMNAALKSFGEGRLAMNELGDELYRLHTGEMRDTLYYHALLTARSVRHPISAHMLWKALRLLPAGALRDEAVASALTRLEELQGEHLSSAMRPDDPARPPLQSRPKAAPDAPSNLLGDGQSSPPPVGDFRERAARMLQAANIPPMRDRSSRMTALTGYDAGRIKELTEPFLLRTYSNGDDSPAERMLMLAVGPPEVDKPAILHGVARELGLRFMLALYSNFRSSWTGELESELLHLLDGARLPVLGGQCRPVMLVLSENGPREGAMPRLGRSAPSPQEVVRALGCLLSGPRRREAAGGAGSAPVILVATISGAMGIENSLRDESFVIRLEPPGAAELERLLILNVVGRYWVCDLDGISFPELGEEAVGLASGEISRVAQRAKLRALARRARQLGAGLVNAPERLRAEISRSYMITQEDLSSVIKAEKLARSRGYSFRNCSPAAAGSPRPQTDLLRWEQGARED
jgi:hypothetical protein